MIDHWAHFYLKNPAGDELEDPDFDLDAVVRSMDEGDWEEVK